MPVLETIAGPDGMDPLTRDVELGDPAEVALEGLPVVISEEASVLPVGPRAARRARARGRRARGRRRAVRRESMRSIRRAMEYYLATLASADGPGRVDDGRARTRDVPPKLRPIAREAVRGRGDHTLPLFFLLLGERLAAAHASGAHPRRRSRPAARSPREVEDVIGDGVLLHPPFPRVAPKHGRTVGQALDAPARRRVQPDGPARHAGPARA